MIKWLKWTELNWTIAHQVPLSMGFPRQEYWNGLPFPSSRDLPNSGIKPMSPAWQADCLPLSHLESPISHYKWFVFVNWLMTETGTWQKISKWPTSMWQYARYHYSPRKWKLKPQWDIGTQSLNGRNLDIWQLLARIWTEREQNTPKVHQLSGET